MEARLQGIAKKKTSERRASLARGRKRRRLLNQTFTPASACGGKIPRCTSRFTPLRAFRPPNEPSMPAQRRTVSFVLAEAMNHLREALSLSFGTHRNTET